MADDLDPFPKLGERVIWCDPHRALPASFWPIVFAWPLCVGVLALSFLGGGDYAGKLLATSFLFLIPLVLALDIAFRSRSKAKQTFVTDRRVLHQANQENRSGLIEVSLGEITDVALGDIGSLSVNLERKDGEIIRLVDLRKPQQLAAAVARGAGLPCPTLIGRLETLGIYCTYLGGFPGFLLANILANDLAFMPQPQEGYGRLPLTLLVDAGWSFLGFLLGIHLAALIAFCLMPRFASAGAARAWLCLKPAKGLARWSRWFGWKHPLYAKLASLVYGEPMNGPNAGVTSHG